MRDALPQAQGVRRSGARQTAAREESCREWHDDTRYRTIYGASAERPRDANGRVWFQLDRGTRLGLEQTADAARIAHYAVRVAPFDRASLTKRLGELGVRLLPAPDERDVVRLADDNGIVVELLASEQRQ